MNKLNLVYNKKKRRWHDKRICVICGKEFLVSVQSKVHAIKTHERISKNPLYKGAYKITCSKKCNEKYRLEYWRGWRIKNPKKVKEIQHRQDKKRQCNPERIKWSKKWRKEWSQNLKFSVMAIYSNGQPKCTCCGETRIEFLTMDHINNDGAEHRRKIGRGNHITYWLRKNGFPEGFQVLCINCNFAKGHYGYCPHEIERKFGN